MRNLPLLLLCLLVQACTPSQKGLGESAKLAFLGADDINMTREQIDRLPYASLYLRINQGQRIFVVLGYDENGQQKWVTRDRTMLVTQHGRLVKTLGLADNLDEVDGLDRDPLADAAHLQEGASWTRTLRWREGGEPLSATAVSRFTRLEDRVLQLPGEQVACRVWQEEVQLSENGRKWRNQFWIDTVSGQVLYARQMLASDDFSVETTLLKPAKS